MAVYSPVTFLMRLAALDIFNFSDEAISPFGLFGLLFIFIKMPQHKIEIRSVTVINMSGVVLID